ncbi:MAG: hypothetical protein ACLFTH_03940 [Candidatus Woesearchaeota archaeon]
MEETFEQKVLRNVKGQFAVYKTTEVVGSKSHVPNLEWEEQDEVDKFFMFAKNLGVKVIYVTEGEETDGDTGNTSSSIVQVGFLHQGIMHHINYADEDYDEDEYYDEDESGEEYSDEEYDEDGEEYGDEPDDEEPEEYDDKGYGEPAESKEDLPKSGHEPQSSSPGSEQFFH